MQENEHEVVCQTFEHGNKAWYLDKMLHRLDGPAVIWNDGTKYWYINGAGYSNMNQWAKAVLKWQDKPRNKEAIEQFIQEILKKETKELI